ncbi:MAG: ABC transporter ATP-binding protein [Desulfobacter sp.]|nr:MAG: ABC transporter ATP-binding protein [Desulfobacter sp.]
MEDLCFDYSPQISALKNISLEICQGEQVALVGHNGSGKTTLVRQLNGLLRPCSGRLRVQGMDTAAHPVSQLAKQTALLFQNPDDQICKSRVWDEVAFGPKNLGYARQKVRVLFNEALALFDLLPLEAANPHDLGYSERKRVAISSVIAMDTPVIVLDEPTAGLDAYEITLLDQMLEKLKQEGKTVIIISHDMDFVAEKLSRVVCLAQGEKTFDGNCRNFFSDDQLLSECGLFAPQVVRLSTHFQQKKMALTPEAFIAGF